MALRISTRPARSLTSSRVSTLHASESPFVAVQDREESHGMNVRSSSWLRGYGKFFARGARCIDDHCRLALTTLPHQSIEIYGSGEVLSVWEASDIQQTRVFW